MDVRTVRLTRSYRFAGTLYEEGTPFLITEYTIVDGSLSFDIYHHGEFLIGINSELVNSEEYPRFKEYNLICCDNLLKGGTSFDTSKVISIYDLMDLSNREDRKAKPVVREYMKKKITTALIITLQVIAVCGIVYGITGE